MWPNTQFHEDLVTYTKEILNQKLHFSCAEIFIETDQKMNIFNRFHNIIFFWKKTTNLLSVVIIETIYSCQVHIFWVSLSPWYTHICVITWLTVCRLFVRKISAQKIVFPVSITVGTNNTSQNSIITACKLKVLI